MIDISFIIVSYNTKELTLNCLALLRKSLSKCKLNYEIIVVDNASTDGTITEIKNLKLKIKNLILIQNETNLGFAKANNQAVKQAQGRYILFLNSDVIIENIDFNNLVVYLDKEKMIGVLTIHLKLENGKTDLASHRGFPTIWRSVCYFSGLERLFGNIPLLNRVFGGYHLLNTDFNTIHEIDSPSGAFFLTRKSILDKIGAFDELFFMYGEDLDLAFRIKQQGYKIIYYPQYSAIHLKYRSGLRNYNFRLKRNIKKHFFEAMKIFYRKHYTKKHMNLINMLVYFIIDLKIKYA